MNQFKYYIIKERKTNCGSSYEFTECFDSSEEAIDTAKSIMDVDDLMDSITVCRGICKFVRVKKVISSVEKEHFA